MLFCCELGRGYTGTDWDTPLLLDTRVAVQLRQLPPGRGGGREAGRGHICRQSVQV